MTVEKTKTRRKVVERLDKERETEKQASDTHVPKHKIKTRGPLLKIKKKDLKERVSWGGTGGERGTVSIKRAERGEEKEKGGIIKKKG